MSGRLLIRDAYLWDGRLLGRRDVLISGERIETLEQPGLLTPLPGDWEVPAAGRVLAPGFVDAHTHLHRLLGRRFAEPMGPGPDFEDRFRRVRLPYENALTPADVKASARAALAEAARSGTTTVIDHLRCPRDPAGALEAVAEAAKELGIRVVTAYAAADIDGREAAERAIEDGLRFAQRVQESPRVRALVGLEASFVCSDGLLARAAAAAKVSSTGVHIHAGEDELDLAQTFARDGLRPVRRLARAGVLNHRSLVAHAMTADAHEAEALAEARALAVLTPRAARAPVNEALFRAGAEVVLGTDGLAADVRADHLVSLFDSRGRARTEDRIDPNSAFRLVASLFGLPEPRLEPGSVADLVLLDHRPLADAAPPLTSLMRVLAAPVSWTIVGGTVVVREGRLLTADEGEVFARARERSAALKLD